MYTSGCSLLRETSSVEVRETVITLTPAAGTIETAIAAAGTLSDPDASEIKIPEGVTITALTVKNGDAVAAGETIYPYESGKLGILLAVEALLNE